MKKLENPAAEVHSSYFAVVNEEECVECGTCEERCHMDAITMDGSAIINLDRCIGCGVCIPDCATEAIELVAKDAAGKYVPPRFIYQAYLKMAKERGKL